MSEHNAKSYEHYAKSYEHYAKSYEYYAKSYEHYAKSYEHYTKSYEHFAKSYEHFAKMIKQGADMHISLKKRALIITISILLLACISIASIFLIMRSSTNGRELTAQVYRDGALIASIPLSKVTESYTFTVTGEGGGRNEIEVRTGSIGIRSADCPDQYCVKQGFIHNSLLPITCLPHRLVIRIIGDTAYDN